MCAYQQNHSSTFWHLELEHNLFKNVSKGPAFLWQTQIQTTKYGLSDTLRIKENKVILILYSFTPYEMNF